MPTMPDLDRLKSQLLTSGLQQKDFPLYQVIDQLIQALRQTINTVDDALGLSSGGGGSALGQSFATVDNEKASLPASRELTAGTGIGFNDTFKRLVINSAMPPGLESEPGEQGEIGPPGIQGPRGLTGPSGSVAAAPYWFTEEQDEMNYPAMISFTNPNMIPETAIIDGTILARVAANETITGNWTFGGTATSFESTVPQIIFRETPGPVDEKNWRIIPSAGDLFIQGVNDAISVADHIVVFQRLGVQTQSIALYILSTLRTLWLYDGSFNHSGAIKFSGQSSVSLSADQTAWNPTGLGGTSWLIRVTPTGVFSIRGILAQAAGTFVTIYQTNANSISFFHEDAAASSANRIQLPSGIGIGLTQFGSVTFYYDGIGSRWILVAWQ